MADKTETQETNQETDKQTTTSDGEDSDVDSEMAPNGTKPVFSGKLLFGGTCNLLTVKGYMDGRPGGKKKKKSQVE